MVTADVPRLLLREHVSVHARMKLGQLENSDVEGTAYLHNMEIETPLRTRGRTTATLLCDVREGKRGGVCMHRTYCTALGVADSSGSLFTGQPAMG